MVWIALLGTLSSLAYYLLCLGAIRSFRRQCRATEPDVLTPVSVLKPLCGLDPHGYESLRSHCVQDYSKEFEIIFGVRDPEDPAIPIAQRLIREFPDRRIHLLICRDIAGSNYKVSNLVQMFPAAQHDRIIVNDSDIAVEPDYLRRVMSEMSDDQVGLVTCLYRGSAGRSIGSRLESLGISTDFVPGVLSARILEGGIRFGLGSTLAFSRKALEAIGGFQSVVDHLGDDYELGRRIAAAGFKVVLSRTIVSHYLPEYSLGDYLQHQVRWARNIRAARPAGYAGLIFTFGLAWAFLTLVLANGAVWAVLLFVITVALRFVVAFVVARRVLNDDQIRRDFWLIPIRDFIGIGVWIVGYLGRGIVWRGKKFRLENGKLRP